MNFIPSIGFVDYSLFCKKLQFFLEKCINESNRDQKSTHIWIGTRYATPKCIDAADCGCNLRAHKSALIETKAI